MTTVMSSSLANPLHGSTSVEFIDEYLKLYFSPRIGIDEVAIFDLGRLPAIKDSSPRTWYRTLRDSSPDLTYAKALARRPDFALYMWRDYPSYLRRIGVIVDSPEVADLGKSQYFQSAVYHGSLRCVKKSVPTQGLNKLGTSPLKTAIAVASQRGHVDILKFLLEFTTSESILRDDPHFWTILFLFNSMKHLHADVWLIFLEHEQSKSDALSLSGYYQSVWWYIETGNVDALTKIKKYLEPNIESFIVAACHHDTSDVMKFLFTVPGADSISDYYEHFILCTSLRKGYNKTAKVIYDVLSTRRTMKHTFEYLLANKPWWEDKLFEDDSSRSEPPAELIVGCPFIFNLHCD